MRIGLPLVGMVLPTILFWLIANQGWRSGFVLLAALALLVGLPACILAIRDLPRAPPTTMNAVEHASPSFWALLRSNHRILLLCLATAFGNAPIVAIASQFQPLMIDLGIDAAKAAGLIGLLAGSVLVGTVVAGALVDRIWGPIVAFLFSVGPLIGCVILLQGQIDMTMAITATILVGLAQGAEIDIIAYLSARYFGLRHYSTIYGCTIMAAVLAAVAGQVTIGVLYDRTGGYESALYLFIGCLVISAILFLSLGRYPADTIGDRTVITPATADPIQRGRAH
ncbi:MFS transporter [Sphingopyxis flava]